MMTWGRCIQLAIALGLMIIAGHEIARMSPPDRIGLGLISAFAVTMAWLAELEANRYGGLRY